MNSYPKQNKQATNFIEIIAKNLNIYRGDGESDFNWRKRVAYSAIGQLALASLWDIGNPGEKDISIVRFKSKIKKEIFIYNDIFAINLNESVVADEIYQQYLENGYMYHKKNRITYSRKRYFEYGKLKLIRSSFPNEVNLMSGLGLYDYNEVDKGLTDISGIFELFNIDKRSLNQTYLNLQERAKWECVNVNWDTDVKFLNHKNYQSYWTNSIEDTHNSEENFSLLRIDPGSYYLYFKKKSQLYVSSLNLDNFNNSYLKPAASILNMNNKLRSIKYCKKENLVKIQLGYKLPPSEEGLFKLYSWPISNSNEDFVRLMSIEVFSLFKETLEIIGYKFQETGKW